MPHWNNVSTEAGASSTDANTGYTEYGSDKNGTGGSFPFRVDQDGNVTMKPTRAGMSDVNALEIHDNPGSPRTSGQLIELFDHSGNPIWSVPVAGGPAVFGDQCRAGQSVFGPFIALDGVNVALLFPSGQRIFSGSGAPSGTLLGSSIADIYFRTDTPSTANQRIYIKTASSTWTGIV